MLRFQISFPDTILYSVIFCSPHVRASVYSYWALNEIVALLFAQGRWVDVCTITWSCHFNAYWQFVTLINYLQGPLLYVMYVLLHRVFSPSFCLLTVLAASLKWTAFDKIHSILSTHFENTHYVCIYLATRNKKIIGTLCLCICVSRSRFYTHSYLIVHCFCIIYVNT